MQYHHIDITMACKRPSFSEEKKKSLKREARGTVIAVSRTSNGFSRKVCKTGLQQKWKTRNMCPEKPKMQAMVFSFFGFRGRKNVKASFKAMQVFLTQ